MYFLFPCQQHGQHGLLDVQPIFRLGKDLVRVGLEDGGGDLLAAVGGQAVEHHAVRLCQCHPRGVQRKAREVAAALLSGDRMTFDALRCEAPELRQLPVATYVWFEKNYLDRDYPLRFVLKCNGVEFPETLKKEP